MSSITQPLVLFHPLFNSLLNFKLSVSFADGKIKSRELKNDICLLPSSLLHRELLGDDKLFNNDKDRGYYDVQKKN